MTDSWLNVRTEPSRAGQRRSALNNDNYDFTMVAYEITPSGPMYVLKVDHARCRKLILFEYCNSSMNRTMAVPASLATAP